MSAIKSTREYDALYFYNDGPDEPDEQFEDAPSEIKVAVFVSPQATENDGCVAW